MIDSVVVKHKDMLRDVLEASKKNMQYNIAEAIQNKRYSQRVNGNTIVGDASMPSTTRSKASSPWQG